MFFASIATSLLVLTPALPDARPRDPSPDILSVRFDNGEIAKVRVLDKRGQDVRLRRILLDGSMEVRHRLDEFGLPSAFRIELAARNPQTAEEHFRMARRAAALGLPDEAGQQVAAAMVLAEGRADARELTRQLRTWSADTLEGWIRTAVDEQDLNQAVESLELLSTRYADLRSEEQLGELVFAVETLEQDRATAQRARRQERMDQRELAGIERRLRPILTGVERGDRLYRDAISKSGKMSQSARLAQDAIDNYTSAWRASLALLERYPDEPSLVIELEIVANHVHDHAVLAALHAANLLAVRSDFVGAMEWVRWVLALDPTHADALRLQQTVISGASNVAGWGLGWGFTFGGTR